MSIEFVYFNKDKNGLYKAQAEENSALYRTFLMTRDVEQTQYFNDNLPNVYDIADDLLSEYADIICFIVNRSNIEFSTVIANAAYEGDNHVDIVFACIEKVEVIESDHIKVFMPDMAVQGLNNLLGIEAEEIDIQSMEAYQNNLFPVKAACEYGILLNKYSVFFEQEYIASVEHVINEINYVSKHTQKENAIVLNSEDTRKYPFYDELMKKIEQLHFPQKIVISENEDIAETTAFINGLQFYLLGYYNDNMVGDYTKHIEVDKSEINKAFLKSLSYHNAGNSALYGTGKTKLVYEDVKEMAKGTGFLFSNYLNFHKHEDAVIEVDINDHNVAFKYQSQPYADYKQSACHNSYVTLDRREDFDELIADYRCFKKTGKIGKERMWKPFVTERCRFGVNGLCSLTRLQKFKVRNGQVYPCSGCSKDIGILDVQHFQLLKKACVIKEKEESIRKCNECKARVYCGKCTMLPDYLIPEEYCQLICEDTGIISYLNAMLDVKFIFEYASIGKFKDNKVSDVTFITRENQVVIPKYVYGEKDYFDINVVFYKYETQGAYVGFRMTDRKAFEMNQNMFILCELMYKGLSYDEITDYLQEEYAVNDSDANILLKKGLHILNEKGYLKKDVYKYGVL